MNTIEKFENIKFFSLKKIIGGKTVNYGNGLYCNQKKMLGKLVRNCYNNSK